LVRRAHLQRRGEFSGCLQMLIRNRLSRAGQGTLSTP